MFDFEEIYLSEERTMVRLGDMVVIKAVFDDCVFVVVTNDEKVVLYSVRYDF